MELMGANERRDRAQTMPPQQQPHNSFVGSADNKQSFIEHRLHFGKASAVIRGLPKVASSEHACE